MQVAANRHVAFAAVVGTRELAGHERPFLERVPVELHGAWLQRGRRNESTIGPRGGERGSVARFAIGRNNAPSGKF